MKKFDKRRQTDPESTRPEKNRHGFGDPDDSRRDSRARDGQRLFCCACMACPVMGGPCGDTREGMPVPTTGSPTPHGLPTRLATSERNFKLLSRSHNMHTTNTTAPLVFQFQSESEIRVVTIDDQPWFVGKDVATALGYTNPSKAISDHCRGVPKRYPIVDSLGRTQEVRILAQSDVLRLIVGSKLPSAEKFERWVFEEVLPSILKTGQYKVGGGETAITPVPVDTSLVNATHVARIVRELAHTAKFLKHTPAPQAKLEAFLLKTFGLACLHLLPVDRVEQVSQWLHQLRLSICEHDVCLETLEARFLAQTLVPQLEAA